MTREFGHTEEECNWFLWYLGQHNEVRARTVVDTHWTDERVCYYSV